MMFNLAGCLFLFSVVLTIAANHLIVNSKAGKILGKVSRNYKGENFYSFMGIPYAQPPIGNLRFKPPVPMGRWKGILNATQPGNKCYQKDVLFDRIFGSEHCLFLNIYTKNPSKKSLKPVMFWIHGGAFIFGSGEKDYYGPEYLLIEDIVLVTINYRLGILGFLSFEDPSVGISGNAGLKDQILALKWVQGNIRNFGGDPNNVTIFGQSAGGASSHYMVLSPLAKGLFHKAIIQSGTALNVWARCQHFNKDAWSQMGIKSDNPKQVAELLKRLPVTDLYQIQEPFRENWFGSTRRYLGPVVEHPDADQAFLTEEPYEIIKSGNYNQVPLIFGFTSMEGIIQEVFKRVATVSGFSSDDGFKDMLANVPYTLNYTEGSREKWLVGEQMKQFYFGGKSLVDAGNSDKYTLFSDVSFNMDILSSVKHHLETSKEPIYQYLFTWELFMGSIKDLLDIVTPGACHGDDVAYLWKNALAPRIKEGSIEEVAMLDMVKMWTNFAKTGNPTPLINNSSLKVTWEPVNNSGKYLNIGPKLQMERFPQNWQERINFWKRIYEGQPALKDHL